MNKSAFMLDTGCDCIKTTVLFDRLQTAAIGGGSREIPNRWVIESVVHFLNLNRKTVRYSIIHQHVALFKARRLEGITCKRWPKRRLLQKNLCRFSQPESVFLRKKTIELCVNSQNWCMCMFTVLSGWFLTIYRLRWRKAHLPCCQNKRKGRFKRKK